MEYSKQNITKLKTLKNKFMKHYKKGRNHVFEFGEMSITEIRLKQSQYEELANYFAKKHHATIVLTGSSFGELVIDSNVKDPCSLCKYKGKSKDKLPCSWCSDYIGRNGYYR